MQQLTPYDQIQLTLNLGMTSSEVAIVEGPFTILSGAGVSGSVTGALEVQVNNAAYYKPLEKNNGQGGGYISPSSIYTNKPLTSSDFHNHWVTVATEFGGHFASDSDYYRYVRIAMRAATGQCDGHTGYVYGPFYQPMQR